MKPTIGRIVHYHINHSGDILAAIVVEVVDQDKEIVNLQLFHNMPSITFEPNVERGLFSGMWSWPPLDPPISHNMRVGGIDVHP